MGSQSSSISDNVLIKAVKGWKQSVSVPRRLQGVFSVECLYNMVLGAYVQLGYNKPADDQQRAIREFVQGHYVFVSLPTGAGKSLCYATLSYVFEVPKGQQNRY